MSQKTGKLARKVAARFGFNERELKTGGDELPAKVRASAYRKMRAALKMQAKTNLDKVLAEWMPK